jgi:hypothetical protein
MNSGKTITPAVTMGIVVVNKGNNKNYQPSSNLPKGKAKPEALLSIIENGQSNVCALVNKC